MKTFKKILFAILIFWSVYTFIDFNFAKTMYSGMELSEYNLIVIIFNICDKLLSGFIF